MVQAPSRKLDAARDPPTPSTANPDRTKAAMPTPVYAAALHGHAAES